MAAKVSKILNFDWNLGAIQTFSLSLLEICSISSFAVNALFLAVFALILAILFSLGIRYRTWGFLSGLLGGFLFELIGYIGRVQLHYNDWPVSPFLMSILYLTIVPCFVAVAVYLCLARIIEVHASHPAHFAPLACFLTFVICNIVAIFLLAAGGPLTTSINHSSESRSGIDIMIAGLSFQIASLTVFIGLCCDFAWRAHKDCGSSKLQDSHKLPFSLFKFHAFLYVLALAVLCIFMRFCLRVEASREDFNGSHASQQVTFIILEVVIILIACMALIMAQAGLIFGSAWNVAKSTSGIAESTHLCDARKFEFKKTLAEEVEQDQK